ncbi:MAG: metal ABC transporter solute-binding protein, Zn/Mn family [bacterium]
MRFLQNSLLILAAAFWLSCSSGPPSPESDGKIQVTVTTSQIADLVKNVGGGRVAVTALMGPGVDPHLYKASQGDIGRLSSADLVFYNGLMLEGRMADILERIARAGGPAASVALGGRLDPSLLHHPPQFEGHPDPHIWMDVSLWARTIPVVIQEISALDPAGRAEYEKNGEAYRQALERLHEDVRQKIQTIPKERRVLVTAHDAFGYFGRAYDIEVTGLQGISTASEFGLQDLQRLVNLITERQIKAVFVESSVPRRSIEALVEGCRARGHEVRVGGELFSDAMGPAGTPEGTYTGMIKHNVNTIVEALK